MKEKKHVKKNIYRILGEKEVAMNRYSNISLVVKMLDRKNGKKMISRHHSTFKTIFILGIILHIFAYIFLFFILKDSYGKTAFRYAQYTGDLACFFLSVPIAIGLATLLFMKLVWYPIVKFTANRTRSFLITSDGDYMLIIKDCKDDSHFGKYSNYPVLDEKKKATSIKFKINSYES